MKFLKIFFNIFVLFTLIALIFKFSVWSINIILLLSMLVLFIDIFYVKA
ncbi:hypothetical protein ACH36K_05180 [Clostridium sp. MB05]